MAERDVRQFVDKLVLLNSHARDDRGSEGVCLGRLSSFLGTTRRTELEPVRSALNLLDS